MELLERGASLQCSDEDGLTALHHASLIGCEVVVEILLDAGANVNAQSFGLGTPLCLAALHKRDRCVRLLLRNRAAVHTAGRWVGTAFHCASWIGSVEVASILLEHGADMTLACQVQLEILQCGAAIGSSIATTMQRKLPRKMRILDCQPMVFAADQGHRELIRTFLSSGYPVNAKHLVWWTSDPTTKSFLEVDRDLRYEGLTALMTASWSGHSAVLLDLLAAGADANARDSGDRSAMSPTEYFECFVVLARAKEGLPR